MRVNKAQRVGVFIDVQNMYYSARALHQAKVDFSQILKESVAGRNLIRAIAYVIKTDIVKDEKTFFDALENIGFEVKAKDLQVFYGGQKKGDWDVGIAMDMIELAPKLDTAILVSGDGDFVPLLNHLKYALGVRVEVMAFGKSCSGKLIEAADSFINMDETPHRYLRRHHVSDTSKKKAI
ncbi:MAG TPA: NYN domain-containing protein [Candidatus Nanoarchaeia archaeon]|nr:NYN domain-containing protein [Candidatus Nanoarchaeia archaeon]